VAQTSLEDRIKVLEAFVAQLKASRGHLAEAISREAGKPLWESNTEVDSMIGKIPLSIAAMNERRLPTEAAVAGGTAATRFRPIGVVAVLGPSTFRASSEWPHCPRAACGERGDLQTE